MQIYHKILAQLLYKQPFHSNFTGQYLRSPQLPLSQLQNNKLINKFRPIASFQSKYIKIFWIGKNMFCKKNYTAKFNPSLLVIMLHSNIYPNASK